MADAELENDPRNTCVGCGPEHETGLRLRFRRAGDRVVTDLDAEDRFEGWPGRLHSGILYLAMLETANWTLYGLLDRVGLTADTSALDLKRWLATGERLQLMGKLAEHEGDAVRVAVEAVDEEGETVAELTRSFTLAGRKAFLEAMGYDEVPAGLEDVLPE